MTERRIATRDRLAWWLANQVLRIATSWYRDMIGASILYGMRSAARDEFEKRDAPSHWDQYVIPLRDER